jgi:predicted kinase
MAGLPASGKDTWLAAHAAGPVVSLDELRGELAVDPDDGQGHVIAAAREQARRYLRDGTSFAWNATNLSPALRGQLLALFRGYRARTRVVYCEATAADQHARNRARASPVPAAVIARMLARWTVPDPSEAHAVSYVVPAGAGAPAWP